MPDDATQTPDPDVQDTARPAGTPSDDRRDRHVLRYVALVLGGVVLGLVGAVFAAARTTVRGTTVPWGLVLVLLALLTCVRGAAWLLGSRRGAALVGLGWVLPTLAFATANPGGDVLLPDELRTYVYLGGATLLVVLAVALPLPRGTRELVAAGHESRDRPADAPPRPGVP
ncbi:MAG TPA: DUF6113 family protein [Candidatus Angelobacter sp.]|nr:DUF6113 family protein [Candidatus Angelobacter sp.]